MSSAAGAEPKDAFLVRAALYAPTRFPPKAFELFRTRSIVTDVVAQQCWLLVLAIAKLHEVVSSASGGVPRVGIIGGGHMGCAVAMALLQNQYPPDKITISTRQPDRVPKCDALASAASQTLFASVMRVYDNTRLSKDSDILVLCVPPSQLKSVAIQIKHALGIASSPCVVVSVLCGTALETIQKAVGTRLVLRTQVDVQELVRRLREIDRAANDDDDDDDDDEPDAARGSSSNASSPLRSLAALRADALALAAEQLTRRHVLIPSGAADPVMMVASPLGGALEALARRLDRALAPARATETVATVLSTCDTATVKPSVQDDDTTTAATKDPALDVEVEAADATAEPPEPPEPLRWRAGWTSMLRQLHRREGQVLTLLDDDTASHREV